MKAGRVRCSKYRKIKVGREAIAPLSGAASPQSQSSAAPPSCPISRFNTSKIAKRLVRNCRAKKCCNFSLKCLDVNNLIHNFASQAKIGCTSAKPIFAPKLQQKDGEQTASSPLREPIKTPNNEIFCPHNALHALPFSKASFRVC